MTSWGMSRHAGWMHMRIAGIVLLVIAVVNMGIDSSVYAYFTNLRFFGAWWAAVFALLMGIGAIVVQNNCNVGTFMLITMVGIIVVLVGLIIDATGALYFNEAIKACTDGRKFYGVESYYLNATKCYVEQVYFSDDRKTYDCYCVDINDGCSKYNGKQIQSNCGNIQSQFALQMSAAACFDFFTLLTLFSVSVITCCSICCPRNFGAIPNESSSPVDGAVPTVVTYNNISSYNSDNSRVVQANGVVYGNYANNGNNNAAFQPQVQAQAVPVQSGFYDKY